MTHLEDTFSVPVYAINLKKRTERRDHTLKEFEGRSEFDLHLTEAVENHIAAIGLWKTVLKIVKEAQSQNHEFIIVCEDDHQFTTYYQFSILKNAIQEAKEKHINVLSGGVSWFDCVVQVNNHLFWTNRFNGLQFTVIFNALYKKILETSFNDTDVADLKISSLSSGAYIMYPFISTQKDFGYSDVTTLNNNRGYIETLFRNRLEKLEMLDKVRGFYQKSDKSGTY